MSNINIVTIDTIKDYLKENSNSKLISRRYISWISFKDVDIDGILRSKIC